MSGLTRETKYLIDGYGMLKINKMIVVSISMYIKILNRIQDIMDLHRFGHLSMNKIVLKELII
jgi:hypothetical protein